MRRARWVVIALSEVRRLLPGFCGSGMGDERGANDPGELDDESHVLSSSVPAA